MSFAVFCEIIVCAQAVFLLWMLTDLVVEKWKAYRRKPRFTYDMYISEEGKMVDFNPQKTQNMLKCDL